MLPSEHTRLINRFIGLCSSIIDWPNTLGELGYEVQLIEQEISLQSAQKIKPDVIAVSNRQLHAIVTDCKGGKNLDNEQLERYKNLSPKDLHIWVTTYDNDHLTQVVCITNNEANHSMQRQITDLPFITFFSDKIVGSGDFKKSDVNQKFSSPISLVGMHEPFSFYPFSSEDDRNVIAPHVLRGVISYLVKKGNKIRPDLQNESAANDILQIIHPFMQQISSRHREVLRKTIQDIIKLAVNSNKDFKEQITKIQSGEINYGTLKSLAGICEKMAEEFEKQRRITDEFN